MTASENLKSPAAVSTIAEFILLLSAFIIERLYTSFYNSHDKDIIRPDHMERLSFFSFSSIILCLVVSIIFAFSVSRICDRVKLWNLLVLAISVLSSILSLVSSSLLINEVSHFANYSTPSGEIDLCQAMRTSGKRACGHLQVASVCGFSAMFLFVGDGILYYFKLSNRIRIAEAGC